MKDDGDNFIQLGFYAWRTVQRMASKRRAGRAKASHSLKIVTIQRKATPNRIEQQMAHLPRQPAKLATASEDDDEPDETD